MGNARTGQALLCGSESCSKRKGGKEVAGMAMPTRRLKSVDCSYGKYSFYLVKRRSGSESAGNSWVQGRRPERYAYDIDIQLQLGGSKKTLVMFK